MDRKKDSTEGSLKKEVAVLDAFGKDKVMFWITSDKNEAMDSGLRLGLVVLFLSSLLIGFQQFCELQPSNSCLK